MSIDKNIWDDQLKNALEGIEGEVPMAAWDAIESSLDQNDRKKRFFFYFTIAALLVIVGGLSIYLTRNNEDNSSSISNEQKIESAEKELPENKIAKNSASNTDKDIDGIQLQNTNDGDLTNSNQSEIKNKPANNTDVKNGQDAKYTDKKVNPKKTEDKTQDQSKDAPKQKEADADKEEKKINDNKKSIAEDKPEKDSKIDDEPIKSADKKDIDNSKDQPIVKNEAKPKKKLFNTNKGNSNSNKTDSKLELGVSVNTSIVKQLIGANAAEEWKLNPRFLEIQEKSINTSGGYVVRFNALYHLNKNIFVSSGVSLTDKRENVSYDFMIKNGVSLDPGLKEMQEFPLNPVDFVEVKYNNTNTYKFAEIPLRIGTIVNLSDRWAFRTELGLNYMRMLQSRGNSIDESYLTLKDLSTHPHLKKNVFGAGIKTGMYLTPAQSQIRFGFEAGYDRTLNSIYSKEAAIKVNPYNYGAYFTANYLLRKK